jgi:hypothetical protein
VKTRADDISDKRRRKSTKSLRPFPLAFGAGSPEDRMPEKSAVAKNYKTAIPSYRLQRARTPGIIEVLNENSYVMAEYSERTGSVKWERFVLASQREHIEKWLEDHYPRVAAP